MYKAGDRLVYWRLMRKGPSVKLLATFVGKRPTGRYEIKLDTGEKRCVSAGAIRSAYQHELTDLGKT